MNIIIWGFAGEYRGQRSGQPIASHAYIHAGYEKAFKALGYDVAWVDDDPGAAGLVRPGDLLFVMDTRAEHVPIRQDCYYVTHNCYAEKFNDLKPDKRLGLQVWTKDATGERLNAWTHYHETPNGRTLFQPWATDLMPDEFVYDAVAPDTDVVNWVGSIWRGELDRGNAVQMNELEDALEAHGIQMNHQRCLDSEHIEAIRRSCIAPAIQGQWQCDVGYLPCRLWKNVSYGQMAITNCEAASRVLPGVYDSDIRTVIDLALSINRDTRLDMTRHAMDIVKRKHTYLNRAQTVLKCLLDL